MSTSQRKGIRSLIRATSASDNPPTGERALIAKSDGWYDRNDAGIETKLGLGGVASITAQVSVSAVTTVTPIVSYAIPANMLTAGSNFAIVATGTVDNAAASPTFNWSVRLGGVVIATIAIASVTTATTAKAWRAEGLMTCRVAGTSGKIVGSLAVVNEIASTFTGAVNLDSPVVNAGVFNTTLAQTLDLTMNMGAAAAGNIMRAEIATVELVRL
jgi:hypothetical protein